IEPAALHGKLRLLQVTLLLLGLQASLDHVGVGDFASTFELLTDIQESGGFGGGPLLVGVFALGYEQAVIRLRYGYNQAAGCDFCPRAGLRRSRRRTPVIREIGQRETLVDICLADVLMDRIVGNKTERRAPYHSSLAVRR